MTWRQRMENWIKSILGSLALIVLVIIIALTLCPDGRADDGSGGRPDYELFKILSYGFGAVILAGATIGINQQLNRIKVLEIAQNGTPASPGLIAKVTAIERELKARAEFATEQRNEIKQRIKDQDGE